MNLQDLSNTEVNEFFDRASRWSGEKFRRSINRTHLQALEQLEFPFPSGGNITDKKQAFTMWVRQHPKFRYQDPMESIKLYAWYRENRLDPER